MFIGKGSPIADLPYGMYLLQIYLAGNTRVFKGILGHRCISTKLLTFHLYTSLSFEKGSFFIITKFLPLR